METKMSFGLGVTLYSYNIDYWLQNKTFEDCMDAVGSFGPGTGIEVVLQQFERNYPYVSDEFERRFKRSLEKNQLVPTMMCGYPDAGLFRGRLYSEESLEFQVAQIRSAHQLGFPNVRLSIRDTKLLEMLLPYAEKYDTTILFEMHCPRTVPTFLEYLELLERLDTPYMGFFPDCGTMCREPSVVYTSRFREQGVPEEIIQLITNLWMQKYTEDQIVEEVARHTKVDGLIELMCRESGEYFAHGEPEDLLPWMKYMKHVHGKFFYVDDNGVENAVRVPEIVSVLKKGGFSGYISAEYEGHHWFARNDAHTQLARYFDLIKKCYAEA